MLLTMRLDNADFCRQFLDHVTPPGYWATLRNQTDAGFLNSFNINSAQHVCMVSELRLRYEHEIRSREKFQKKFTNNSVVYQQRDAEIVALKARLELAEKEAAEVVVLRSRVFYLETRTADRSEEVDALSKHNAELLGKVSALESEREKLNRHITRLGADCESLRNEVAGEAKLREEFKSFQDAKARRFEEKYAKLEAQIADVRRDIDNDLYPHMFTAIAGQRWVLSHDIDKGTKEGLEAGIEHRKAGRSLTQPHLDQVTIPIYSKSGSIIQEMPLSDVVLVVRVVADVSTLTLITNEVLVTQPLVAQPHDDLFDANVLDKPGDA
ncbi:hypothetical protein Tco_1000577 [Tanacetum coccineum]